jgi:hypothetical protein
MNAIKMIEQSRFYYNRQFETMPVGWHIFCVIAGFGVCEKGMQNGRRKSLQNQGAALRHFGYAKR